MEWITGLIISCTCAGIAYWRNHLSFSGLMAAGGVGTFIMGGMGWPGFIVLTFFFITSSAISKWPRPRMSHRRQTLGKRQQKTIHASVHIAAKGDRRDMIQVLANGGVAAFASLFFFWSNHSLWVLLFCSALAAATADTWASELGKFSRSEPRDILTWKKVRPGTSGAVSLWGTIASGMGALATAVVSIPLVVTADMEGSVYQGLAIIGVAGWLGNGIDTWAGAKWQVRYRCMICKKETERRIHCHRPTERIQGIRWIDNDVVNLLCTLSGGLLGMFLFYLL